LKRGTSIEKTTTCRKIGRGEFEVCLYLKKKPEFNQFGTKIKEKLAFSLIFRDTH